MNDVYVEYSFPLKTPFYRKIAMIFLIIIGAVLIFYSLYFPILSTIGLFFLVLAYFIHRGNKLEYEYILLNNELTIYKIIASSKRKKIYTVDLNYLECLMKNGKEVVSLYQHKTKKIKRFYASQNIDPVYALMLVHGNMMECLLINADKEFIAGIKKRYPLKVKIEE